MSPPACPIGAGRDTRFLPEYLSFSGPDLVVGAGLGPSTSLSRSQLNLDGFIEDLVLTPKGGKILKKIASGVDFRSASREEQAELAIEVFCRILRDAGRAQVKTGNYKKANQAIKSLFGEGDWDGDIVVSIVSDALNLLSNPQRLVATLRS